MQPSPEPTQVLGLLNASALKVTRDLVRGTTIYEGNVVAEFGQSKLFGDRLELDEILKTAHASGKVLVKDPEGQLTATDLYLSWGKDQNDLSATEIVVDLSGLHLRASQARISGQVYTFDRVFFTASNEKTPSYDIRASRIIYEPKVSIRLEHPRLDLFGVAVLALSKQKVSQAPGASGLGYPTATYRSDYGYGLTYGLGYAVDKLTVASFGFDVFTKRVPSYGAQVSHSLLAPGTSNQGDPSSEAYTDDRFSYGYFDYVAVGSPDAEFNLLGQNRNSIGISGYFNRLAVGRREEGKYTEPIEIALIRGGHLGGLTQLSHFRLQTIRSSDTGPFITRPQVDTSVEIPKLKLSEALWSVNRLDGSGNLGDHAYGWIRGQMGLFYKPNSVMTLGAAKIFSGESGVPDFPADRLFMNGGYHVRADLDFGATGFSYMLKFRNGGREYDNEYIVTQVAGPLNLSLTYRGFPSEYRIGIGLRIGTFLKSLSKRQNHDFATVPSR